MTEDEYSEKHLRLRCLEIAKPLFPTTADMDAMLRAAEKLWTFVNAKPVAGSGESGSPSGPYSARLVAAVADANAGKLVEFDPTKDHYSIRAGNWDEDEIKRMNES